MQQEFPLHFPLVNRTATIRKSPYSLVILREGLYSVSVDKLPLVEYFVFFDSPLKSEQMKLKFYKTKSDGKWYDKSFSEEAELNSPEFGIAGMNEGLKASIDAYESDLVHEKIFSI
jgi:predicted restriction endonuclease